MDLTISRVPAEEKAEVEEFVKKHFMPDMPLFVAFGLQDEPPPRPPNPQAGPEDFSVRAVDQQGEVLGVAVNKVHPSFYLPADAPDRVKEMVELMQYAEREAALDRLPERTIELRILAVRREARRLGLARRLAEESVKLAREAGFTAMTVCCTSEFTAKLARSMGWRELYRLKYSEYGALTGKHVDMQITPPHQHLYYYITDL